jgi:RHS repeat-associated protein
MLHQRTNQTRYDNSLISYTYDSSGQLQTGLGKENGGSDRLHEQFRYTYDAAGNVSNGVENVLTNVFNVNSLNELTTITRTTNLTLAGFTTTNASSVTVNGGSATRDADNTFAKANLALVNGTNTFTAVATDAVGRGDTNTAISYLPSTNSFAYDANGNLLTNGTRFFEYDDENQLIRITDPSAWKSEFSYDGRMRLRISRDYEWRTGAWVQTNEIRRVYDGMLVIQERNQFNLPTLSYTRGLDLSGSRQAAGGIGGLLALSNLKSVSPEHAYYHADGNGNVTVLMDTAQRVVARYLYDPFGNTLAATGPWAELNRYRFSSKEWHPPSALIHYLYRWYAPEWHRWLNADPIAEEGGVNLYAISENDLINYVDTFGLQIVVPLPGKNPGKFVPPFIPPGQPWPPRHPPHRPPPRPPTTVPVHRALRKRNSGRKRISKPGIRRYYGLEPRGEGRFSPNNRCRGA